MWRESLELNEFSAELRALMELAACIWFYIEKGSGSFLLHPSFSDCQYFLEKVLEAGGFLAVEGLYLDSKWGSRM